MQQCFLRLTKKLEITKVAINRNAELCHIHKIKQNAAIEIEMEYIYDLFFFNIYCKIVIV